MPPQQKPRSTENQDGRERAEGGQNACNSALISVMYHTEIICNVLVGFKPRSRDHGPGQKTRIFLERDLRTFGC